MTSSQARREADLPPPVWVVASHRTLDNEHGHPQPYTLVDEAGSLAGGELERLAGCSRFAVSSLHPQGVRRLGDGWVAEGHADDGLIEAFRRHDRSRFAWGIQFHPESDHRRRTPYGRIMAAYVEACWERLGQETPQVPACV